LGGNEIKFRPYPLQNTANTQEALDEIKKLIINKNSEENKKQNEELNDRLFYNFIRTRYDLLAHANALSLLILALEREDVKYRIGNDYENIISSLYEQIEYVFVKCLAMKHLVTVFAGEVQTRKIELEKMESINIEKRILELRKHVPEKYQKFNHSLIIKNAENHTGGLSKPR